MLVGATGTSPLLFLAFLACPVGMILMMVFMGRGMRGGMKQKETIQPEEEATSLAAMKAEQARLAEKIEAFESTQKPAESAGDLEVDRVR